jgi:hypothetical protein
MVKHPVYRCLKWLLLRFILLLPMLPVAYEALRYRRGIEGVFPPGPVATVHEGLHCKECHVEPWRGWQKLLGRDRQIGAAMDRACAHCHGGLMDGGPPNLRVGLAQRPVVPPPTVAPHHPRQILREVGNCADCHHEHRGDKGLLQLTEDHCLRCHQALQTVDGQHTFYPKLTAFDTDHPPFGWWHVDGLQDPAALHFNHQMHLHLEGKGLHDIAGALARLEELGCGYCHQPDARGRRMVPVRYEKACAACHPLNVRIVAEPAEAAASAIIEAFCRQPAPHVAPALVSAVLRERLRLLAQQHPKIAITDPRVEPLRCLPGRRPEPPIPRDLADWVDYQTSQVSRLLFDSPGGCRYCHIAKNDTQERFAPVEYEPTNVPVSWFPYAKFSHAKHGLMACSDCHEQARTSSHTRDVLMPVKQTCVQCHSNRAGPQGRARADCLECHEYHSHRPAVPASPATRRHE